MQKIEIRPSFVVAVTVLVLSDRGWLFCAVALSSVIHECGHLVAFRCCGVHVKRMVFTAAGATIVPQMGQMSHAEEGVCLAAGPFCSLAAAAALMACGGADLWIGMCLLHGLGNLLPAEPLDGGGILRCLCRDGRVKLRRGLSFLCVGLMLALGVMVFWQTRGNWSFAAVSIAMLWLDQKA